MREQAFIKQNKDKWKDFESKMSGHTTTNPDELSSLYVHLMNDLSYARTFYPDSDTYKYLNALAAKAYHRIYTLKREERNRIRYFFETEVPLLVYRYRRYLWYAIGFFLVFVALGVISARYDDGFIRLILGDEYVNMTLENIRKGDPLAVYKSGASWAGHVAITVNNIRVGFYMYVLGFFGGLGTVYVLFRNGVMLGAFQYLFYKYGVLGESIRGIWIHGSMEIFAMIVEAMAGLILGAGILFPGTYSRLESFKRSVNVSMKIFMSTFPFTLLAAVLEAYVTRNSSDMSVWLSWGIILTTLGFISFYYLVYPRMVYLKHYKEQSALS